MTNKIHDLQMKELKMQEMQEEQRECQQPDELYDDTDVDDSVFPILPLAPSPSPPPEMFQVFICNDKTVKSKVTAVSPCIKMLPKFKMAARGQLQKIMWAQKL